MDELIPIKKIFGNTGREVTQVGLGGEGVLRTQGRKSEARDVIKEAIAQGITYFDSAQAYEDSEIYLGSVWGASPETRVNIFQASKSASRDKKGALKDLENSLKRLQTTYLDLWQIHDVRTKEDLEEISGKGGALEAFLQARNAGKARFIGVTGHHDPAILTKAVTDWPVDAVMMPVNPVEGILGGFLTSTLDAARAKGIAVIGMKVLGASHYLSAKLNVTAELLIRYALSHEITVVIVGCSNINEVKTLAKEGSVSNPLSEEEIVHLNDIFKPETKRLAFYRGMV